jgi:hypothetical protein
MKTSLLPSLVLAVTLVASAFAAVPFRSFELALPPGSSPDVVRKALGEPSATMGPELWVYFQFAKSPNASNPAYDTLVIAFEQKRVIAVKVTDGRVVRQLLAQYKTQSVPANVAVR